MIINLKAFVIQMQFIKTHVESHSKSQRCSTSICYRCKVGVYFFNIKCQTEGEMTAREMIYCKSVSHWQETTVLKFRYFSKFLQFLQLNA